MTRDGKASVVAVVLVVRITPQGRAEALLHLGAACREQSQSRVAGLPLAVEFCAGDKGFLRADLGCGERSVQIRARERFLLGKSFAEKHSEAADESVAGAGGVEGVHFEWWDELGAFRASEQATAFAEREDNALKALT